MQQYVMDRSDNTVTDVYIRIRDRSGEEGMEKSGRKEWGEGRGMNGIYILPYRHTHQQMKILFSTEVWNI